MECWLETWDGRRLRLPQVLEWTFRYGVGTPCDSFSLSCLWDGTEIESLRDAVGFAAAEGEERRFTGVLDEAEAVWDENGARLFLHGRGMAALLLDNEAEGADYQIATVEEILRDHVSPYGIRTVGGNDMAPVPGFSVETGSSEWAVLYAFARYHHGVEPWFDVAGRLHLDGWKEGARRTVDGGSPVCALRWSEKRYGVLSEVLVRDRSGGRREQVHNGTFAARGGRRRKVLTLPQKSGYETMRYSGAYQIARSAEEEETCTLRLAQLFAAQVGDLLELRLDQPALGGCWRVHSCETGSGPEGAYTELELRGRERA